MTLNKFTFISRVIALISCIFWPLTLSAQDTVFEVEALNTGLAPATAPDFDLSTPQSAMETFLLSSDNGDWDTAARVLNLNSFDPTVQSIVGPDLAQKLAAIIDRKVIVSWQQLLERPDSLDANAPSDRAMAGQPRKSLLLAVLDLQDRAVALRLNRLQPENGDAVWMFASQSVDNIDALYVEHGPSALEKAMPAPLRAPAFGGLTWWEVIGLPLIALLALGLAGIVWRTLGRLASGRDNPTTVAILRGLRWPLTLVVLALTIWLTTTEILVVSGPVSSVVEPLIVLLYVVAAMMLAINVIDAILGRIVARDLEDLASPQQEDRRALATTVSAVRRMAIVVAIMLGAGIVLSSAKIFQTLGFSLLAGAGALTVILGFAGREALSNILASMQISLNRAARVGDQLIYEGHLCHVEEINFTFVQLKVWDGTRMIVPVSEFVSQPFINRNIVDSMMVRHATLIISHQTDIPALRQAFCDWANGDDRVGDSDLVACQVVNQNEFGIHVRLAAPVPDPRDGWDVECEMREAMITWLREQEADGGPELVPHLGTGLPEDAEDQDDAA